MLKILTFIVAGLLCASVVLLAVASTRPDTFVISRSAMVKAPPEKIYPLIEDFRKWRGWSPYETLDPDLKRAYSGASHGIGAAYAWSGKKAGAGDMLITEATSPSRVVIRLRFTAPMKAENTARFHLEPQGDATKVTWEMSGRNPLMAKVVSLVFNMDAMIGKDFEKGLAKLKAAAEPQN